MADRYQTLNNGCKELNEATTVSTGVAEAGDIIALGPDGKIDPSLLPTGVGDDVKAIEAGEAIDAGDFVNIYDDGGTTKIRKADNSNGREADGFVLTAATLGSTATVYFEGGNTALTGLTAGTRYYLDTAGNVTATPVDPDTAAAGTIHQYLGKASASGELCVEMDDKVVL